MKNNIFLKTILVVLLTLIQLVGLNNGQLTQLTPITTLSLSIENPNYSDSARAWNDDFCFMSYDVLIFNNDKSSSLLEFNTNKSQPTLIMKLNDNSTYLYQLILVLPLGSSQIYNLTIISNNSVEAIYQLNQTCRQVIWENKFYELDSFPYPVGDYFSSMVLIREEDEDIFLLLSKTNTLVKSGVKNYYITFWEPFYYLQKDLNDSWSKILPFGGGKYLNITTKSYWGQYKEIQLPNQPIETIFYPTNINNNYTMYTEFGSNNVPLFKSIIKSEISKPYMYLCMDSSYVSYSKCIYFSSLVPIKSMNGNLTFVGALSNELSGLNNYSISTGNKNLFINSFIQTNYSKFNTPLTFTNLSSTIQYYKNNDISTFLYSFNTTSPFKFTFFQSFYFIQLITEWPFGFSSGNNKNYTYSSVFSKYEYSGIEVPFFIFGTNGIINDENRVPVTTIQTYTNPPQVVSCKFIKIYGFKYILSVDFISTAGLQHIVNSDITIFGIETLVRGDTNNGTFEILVKDIRFFFNFWIYDNNNSFLKLTFDDFYSLKPLSKFESPTLLPQPSLNLSDIMDISYSINDLDLKDDNNIIVYLNSTNLSPDYYIAILLEADTEERPFVYNSTLGLFTSKLIIKKNSMLSGNVLFYFIFGNNGQFHNSLLPNSAHLRVNSTSFDNEGPLFTKMEKIGDGSEINQNGGLIGWSFTISDDMNGFARGYIKVIGSIDSSTYHFNFTERDFVLGNRISGVYRLLINVSGSCISQSYSITKVELVDTGGVQSSFDLYNNLNPISSPFYNLYQAANDGGLSITSISFLCSSSIIDASIPSLLYFTSSKTTIDVGSINRSITFDFAIKPTQSGIKKDQLPIIYLITKRMEKLECNSKLLSNNSTSAIYTCTTQLPLGFGYPGSILFSVYGFVNNGGQYYGFSTADLLKSINPINNAYISTTLTIDQPIITSNSPYFNGDTELLIYGRSLSNIDRVIIEDGESGEILQTLSPSSIYGSLSLKISGVEMFKSFTITMINTKTSAISNKFTINPVYFKLTTKPIPTPSPSTPTSTPTLTPTPTPTSTPIPTNPPQKCLGNPICGGDKQGCCVESGCVCISPWIGVDCSSQIIIVPTPTINNTEPSVEIPNLPIGNNNTNIPEVLFKSFVSLVSLREVDFNGQQIENHIFDKWIYKPLSELKNQYTATVLNTNISATLEWFNSSTIIDFANQKISMNPSTIKYTIEIEGAYQFTKQLNSLQLVMSASLKSSKTNEICSNKQFGNTSTGDDSNYIKIQIDNHSLYGRFIKRAIVDGDIRGISNQLLDSSLNPITTSSSIQSYIAINIPHFKNSIIVDPDFSVLIDSKSASTSSGSICSLSSSRLNNAQLTGIIIGSVAFVFVIILVVTYIIVKNKKSKLILLKMNNKLKNMN